MAADASAYTALGLAPGADWEAVQLAYKKLIKRYHPDRDGGDAARAAEINRAYREIRRAREERDRRVFGQVEFLATPPRRRRWVWVVVGVVAAAAGAAPFVAEPLARFARDFSLEKVAPLGVGDVEGDHAPDGNMDRPLAVGAIDGAVGDALRMARGRDELALASTSRECHRQLRLAPSLERLDRCAAFDDAVVLLQNRDPLRDLGPFSELAITGRQLSGAAALSTDSLAIDDRLDRIRLHVELALAPAQPADAPPPTVRSDPPPADPPATEPHSDGTAEADQR